MVRDWEKIGQPARMGVSRSRDTCRCFKFQRGKNFNYSDDASAAITREKEDESGEYLARIDYNYYSLPIY